MNDLKMTGDFYEDVKIVGEAVCRLHGMLEFLEKECIEMDKGQTASDKFIYINDMKNEVSKAVEQSKQLIRTSDIDQYGSLSKYIRGYLG
jgi:hypothetical protein